MRLAAESPCHFSPLALKLLLLLEPPASSQELASNWQKMANACGGFVGLPSGADFVLLHFWSSEARTVVTVPHCAHPTGIGYNACTS